MAQSLAAMSAGLATIVIIFFDWVPTPLNRNIVAASARDRRIGGLIHVTAGIVIVAANLLNWRWIVLAGAVWYSFVLVTALLNWWVPWLTGITVGEIKPDVYQQDYARNVRVLPRLGRSPIVPDVQHTLIHLAVLLACVSGWVSVAAA
jgi:hypothetical protein